MYYRTCCCCTVFSSLLGRSIFQTASCLVIYALPAASDPWQLREHSGGDSDSAASLAEPEPEPNLKLPVPVDSPTQAASGDS